MEQEHLIWLVVDHNFLDNVQFGDKTLLVVPGMKKDLPHVEKMGFSLPQKKKPSLYVDIQNIKNIRFSELPNLPQEDLIRAGYESFDDMRENFPGKYEWWQISPETPIGLVYFNPPDGADILQNVRRRLYNGLSHIFADHSHLDEVEVFYTQKKKPVFEICIESCLPQKEVEQIAKWCKYLSSKVEFTTDDESAYFSLFSHPFEIKQKLDLFAEIRSRQMPPPPSPNI